MKVGVLGSGGVAKALGSGFLKHGHEVMLGTRTAEKLSEWAKANPKYQISSSFTSPPLKIRSSANATIAKPTRWASRCRGLAP